MNAVSTSTHPVSGSPARLRYRTVSASDTAPAPTAPLLIKPGRRGQQNAPAVAAATASTADAVGSAATPGSPRSATRTAAAMATTDQLRESSPPPPPVPIRRVRRAGPFPARRSASRAYPSIGGIVAVATSSLLVVSLLLPSPSLPEYRAEVHLPKDRYFDRVIQKSGCGPW